VVAGRDAERKQLAEDRPMIAISFAGIDEGDVDPLLFQLSISVLDEATLLFLPSGRPSVDELVKTKASQYGLRGKRPRVGSDHEPWILGSVALVGMPTALESAQAVQSGTPIIFFSSGAELSSGNAFLVQHGAAIHSSLPVTFSVDLESILPKGRQHSAVEEALAALNGGGALSVAEAIIEAGRAGRPTSQVVTSVRGDDELEDIGAPSVSDQLPQVMGADMRRSYLSEIILRQKKLESQLSKAQTGLTTWRRRVELAQGAGRDDLQGQAAQRVAGLEKVVNRLENQLAGVMGLRDRLVGQDPLTSADRQLAAQLLGRGSAGLLGRDEREPGIFAQLEVDDALKRLKEKLNGPS
jgi:hypothetical protein